MADFPQRSKAFDPMAYRSQAVYNAHMPRRQSNEKPSEPTKAFNKNAYRNKPANNTSHGKSKAQNSEPKKSINRMAYRNHAAHNASHGHSNKQQTESTKINHSRVAQKTNASKQHRSTAKDTTYAEEQAKEDAYVKQFFAEATPTMRRRRRGEFDDYVPAAGRAPDFTKFRQMFDTNGKPDVGFAEGFVNGV
ncbi:hypothetical protein QBC32DRAFT_393460 [Pseudoneurospora amorphoporcata]|uniref:Uncharacterized protein n=1 Tax=Pseudoneurospora amorphoporcata TaxID=241081 RepID=A0AAN6NSH7_9PEZI|nr:hypothetical protein QBC32DRAFT_393460 [Pseudoneurospora amorphoporcata]